MVGDCDGCLPQIWRSLAPPKYVDDDVAPVRVAGKLLLGAASRRYKIALDHAAMRGLKLRFLATSGTSFRAAAISQVVRRSTSRIVGHAALHARLVPEPGNAYDRRALRVEVAG